MAASSGKETVTLKPRIGLGDNGADVKVLVSNGFDDGFITANEDGTFTLLDGTSYNTVGEAIEDTIRAIIGIDNDADYQYSNAKLEAIEEAIKNLSPSQKAEIQQELSIFTNAARAEQSNATAYSVEARYILNEMNDPTMPLGRIINAFK